MTATCTNCGAPVARFRANRAREPRCVPCAHKALRRIDDDEFRKVAHLPNKELCAMFRVYEQAICEARKRVGIPAPPRGQTPAPADFADRAADMTLAQLVAHYGRSDWLVRQWLKAKGLRAVSAVPVRKPRGPGSTGWKSFGQRAAGDWTKQFDASDSSRAGMAARFLRRFGPVYRCDAGGKPLPDGFFWNRGGFVLSDEEVIERALRNGWAPDAWMAVAA